MGLLVSKARIGYRPDLGGQPVPGIPTTNLIIPGHGFDLVAILDGFKPKPRPESYRLGARNHFILLPGIFPEWVAEINQNTHLGLMYSGIKRDCPVKSDEEMDMQRSLWYHDISTTKFAL